MSIEEQVQDLEDNMDATVVRVRANKIAMVILATFVRGAVGSIAFDRQVGFALEGLDDESDPSLKEIASHIRQILLPD